MMTSLFSIFDPSLSLMGTSYLSSFLIFMFLPSFFWLNSYLYNILQTILGVLSQEVKYMSENSYKGILKYFSVLFFFIFFLNFLSLFPHYFSFTSHLFFTLPVSFVFWIMTMVFVWSNFLLVFLSHLIPSGTPTPLISFMVLVEIMSNIIRPVALTFRLTANMMAGHLLLSIIGSSFFFMEVFFMVPMMVVQSVLVLMELGVSLIQSYVFSVLLFLYLTESSS